MEAVFITLRDIDIVTGITVKRGQRRFHVDFVLDG